LFLLLFLVFSPVQLTPLPEYPVLQAQVNPWEMEVHAAFALQLFNVEFAQKFWAATKIMHTFSESRNKQRRKKRRKKRKKKKTIPLQPVPEVPDKHWQL